MAPTDPVTDEPAACPYLGLPDDPRTRFTFATPAHRCHVERKPSPIDLGHQGVYCLSSDFPACKRFRAPAAVIGARAEPARTAGRAVATAIPEVPSPVAPAPAPVAPPSAAANATDDRKLSVAPEAVSSAPLAAASGSKRSVRRRALLLLIVLAVAALAAAVATGSLDRLLPAGVLLGAVALPSATAAETPLANSPSPVASLAPTAAPSAAAASPVTHIVQPGESLTSIAARYRVMPQAIRLANHLEDPNLVRVGQNLIIPPAH